jgi:23S rRNA pseudouridine1911/1915/1917 synthase
VNGGFSYRERIGPEAEGETVLAYLVRRYRHSKEVQWLARIEAGEVRVGDASAEPGTRLRRGQTLVWNRPPWEEPSVPLGFAVIHQDADLVAVAKPRGLPTVPNGGFLENTLLKAVEGHFPGAVPLHRLGRGTSGVVLFGLTPHARRALSKDWRDGRVEKTYLALIAGVPSQSQFTVDVPIGLVPHPRLGQVHAATANGKSAVSHVSVLERQSRDDLSVAAVCVVAVRIPTGRPHQIRIHLAAAGHPLVGDPLYAVGGVPTSDPGLPGDGGYRLHAFRLGLEHPTTNRRVVVECAPPPELRVGPRLRAPAWPGGSDA